MWLLQLPPHLPVVVALQKQEVGEVKWRVDGVLGGVVIAALRLLLLRAKLQRLFVGLGFRVLPQGALLGPSGLLRHVGQVHVAQTPPEAQRLHVLAAAIHKERGHPGAALLQLSCLRVDAWTEQRTGRLFIFPATSRLLEPEQRALSSLLIGPNSPKEVAKDLEERFNIFVQLHLKTVFMLFNFNVLICGLKTGFKSPKSPRPQEWTSSEVPMVSLAAQQANRDRRKGRKPVWKVGCERELGWSDTTQTVVGSSGAIKRSGMSAGRRCSQR